MGKTFKNFRPIRAAHMHRKLETGKRCICAFPHRLENGRYLPPIFRAIGLHVQKLNKKLTAYAEACEYPYGYFKGEDRMRDASPFIFPGLLIAAWRERLWGTTISQRSPWCGVRSCLRQPRPIFLERGSSGSTALLEVPPLSHLRAIWRGRPGQDHHSHHAGEPGVFFRFPPPPLQLGRGSYAKSAETTYGGARGAEEEVRT